MAVESVANYSFSRCLSHTEKNVMCQLVDTICAKSNCEARQKKFWGHRVAKRREGLKKQHGVLFFPERDRAAVRPSPPTVCMSITLFAVGADSISARLVFREHMECSPTVFKSKILFACSRIVTVLIAYCCRGRRPRRPVTKQKLHSFRNGRAMRAPTVFVSRILFSCSY